MPEPDDGRSGRLELDVTQVQPLVDRYAEWLTRLENVNARYTDDRFHLIPGTGKDERPLRT